MTLRALPVKEISLEEMPFYFRRRNTWNVYIKCGNVKRGGNEPYSYPEEKQCAGHVCRVLCPRKTYYEALVIRDDGTVWKINLSAFQEVYRITIKGERDALLELLNESV